jgi:predicted HTH domain antitoxin
MKTITLNIPEQLELDSNETIRFLAAKLYESGKLTLGQAAKMAGLSKMAFSEIIGDYGVSLFNYPADEIINDAARI